MFARFSSIKIFRKVDSIENTANGKRIVAMASAAVKSTAEAIRIS